MRLKYYKCSYCKKTGHDKRNCKVKEKKENEKKYNENNIII